VTASVIYDMQMEYVEQAKTYELQVQEAKDDYTFVYGLFSWIWF